MFVEHKEAMEVTEAPVKTLKFSEAIRIGAAIRPQCKWKPFFSGGSCALGAAYEGLTGEVNMSAGQVYAYLDQRGLHSDLLNAVHRHNDLSEWSREKIADWLEAQGL